MTRSVSFGISNIHLRAEQQQLTLLPTKLETRRKNACEKTKKKLYFYRKYLYSIENQDCTSRNRFGLLRRSSSLRPGRNNDSNVMTSMNNSNTRKTARSSQRGRVRGTSNTVSSAGSEAKANSQPKSAIYRHPRPPIRVSRTTSSNPSSRQETESIHIFRASASRAHRRRNGHANAASANGANANRPPGIASTNSQDGNGAGLTARKGNVSVNRNGRNR